MATIATLVAKLVGDIGPFQQSMKQAANESAGFGSRIAGGMNNALGTIGSVAKVAAGAAVAGIGAVSAAAVGGVVAFNSWADELDSIGDVLGTTADESAGLAVAIKTVGGDVEGITGQMAKLTRGLEGANGKMGPSAQLMTKLGIAFKDSNGKLLSSTTILGNVANKLAAMPDGLEKTRIMTDLFGKSGKDLSDTMNALANGGLDAAQKKAEALGLAIGDEGVEKSIAMGKSMKTLEMALQGVAVSIGSALMPLITPLIEKFAAWAVEVMPQVRAAIEGVFNWIATNVGPILESMIAGFQAIVAWVQANWPAIQSAIEETWNNIMAVVGPAVQAIGDLIRAVFGAIATFLQTHGEDIKNFIGSTWNTIREIVEPVIKWFYETITAIFGGLAKWIGENQGEIQRIFEGVWNGIKMFVGVVLDAIRGVVKVVMALLKGDVQGALDAIGEMFRSIWDRIKDTVAQAVETVRMILLIAWAKIKEGVENVWNGIRTWIEGAWEGIMNFFRTLPAKLYLLGKQIIEGLWNGIKSMFADIGKGISDFFQNTIDDIKKKLGVQSPSTVMADIGRSLMSGLALGIRNGADLPQLALDTAMNGITSPAIALAPAAAQNGNNISNTWNVTTDQSGMALLLERQRQMMIAQFEDRM